MSKSERHTWRLTAAMIAAVSLLFACSSNTEYYHFESLTNEQWDCDTVLQYAVAPHSGGDFDAQLILRVTPRFPYRQLAMLVTKTVVRGKDAAEPQTRTETVPAEVAVYGGGDNPNTSFTTHYAVKTVPLGALRLAAGDSLHVAVRHNMRRYVMPGVSDVGLKLTRRKP